MMDANEVITLSSDEEQDSVTDSKPNLKKIPLVKLIQKNYTDLVGVQYKKRKELSHNQNCRNEKIIENVNRFKEKGSYSLTKEVSIQRNSKSFKFKNIPEVVDLVDQSPPEEFNRSNDSKDEDKSKLNHETKNHSNIQILNNTHATKEDQTNSNLGEIQNPKMTDNHINETSKIFHGNDVSREIDITEENEVLEKKNEEAVSNVNIVMNGMKQSPEKNSCSNVPEFFNEFVNLCGSYEDDTNDRTRLVKKLQKCGRETDPEYLNSDKFNTLLEKSKKKLNKTNLYLIAKDITDELSFKRVIPATKSNPKPDQRQVPENENVVVSESNKLSKKKLKMLKKINRRLDKLGDKIHELENAEVDLWNEEDNTYLQLQRYRERYCQIYKKLCEYTNEVSDAGRVFSRKICFTGSKYPAINSCIEKWLNKTKRFPDFSDIMKLLESQSGALGLPSNKDSIRVVATEIFQEVGKLLQLRRKYDLWDTLSGFLDSSDDPANNDPQLEKVLRENYEVRLKKTQEIVNYYAEKQEKERMEPEEVPEEEANQSPESGNEDEKEIEDVEKSINEKLDDVIEEQLLEEGNEKEGAGENGAKEETPTTPVKESKNNYKNCKSLKWRKSKEGGNSEDSNLENETDNKNSNGEEGKEGGNSEDFNLENKNSNGEAKEAEDSDLELISIGTPEPDFPADVEMETESVQKCLKRESEEELPSAKKKKLGEEVRVVEIDIEKEYSEGENGLKNVFDVRYCRLEQNFGNLEKLELYEEAGEEKREWGRRRVFRDLTNVNRLLELNGRRKKSVALFSHSFYHRSLRDLDKPSWKKRFTLNYKFVGVKNQKCALNAQEKTGKGVDGEGEGEEKESQNGSESGGDEGGMNFFGGHGSGSEEDNNENDENGKKSRDSGDDVEENKHEEDEEEEDKNEETGDGGGVRAVAHSNNYSTPDDFPSCQTEKEKPGDEINNPNQENTTGYQKLDDRLEDEIQKDAEERNEDDEMCEKIEGSLKDKSEIPEGEELEKTNKERGSNSEVEKGLDSEETNWEPAEMETEEEGGLEGEREVEKNEYAKDEEAEGTNLEVEVEEDNKTERTEGSRYNEKLMESMEWTSGDEEIEEKTLENIETEWEDGRGPNLKMCTKLVEDSDEEFHPREEQEESFSSTKIRETVQRTPKPKRKSTSDEERVKKFLLHSPSSISITPPKKLSLGRPPSQAALQALATLRGLKGISATRVRVRPRPEDEVVVIGESPGPPRQRRRDLPRISNVHSIQTPKIVTVQGNASGFNGRPDPDSTSIKISKVWGNLPPSIYQSMHNNEAPFPGSSFPASFHPTTHKKKNTKKSVEYVVLE